MNTKSLTVAVFLLACPLSGQAQLAPQTPPAPVSPAPPMTAPAAPAVTLRYKFAVGQTHRYQYDMDMNGTMLTGQSGAGLPLNSAAHIVLRQTVKDIRPADGAATISVQIEKMTMSQNGTEVPLPEAQQAQMKRSYKVVLLPSGKTLSAETPSPGGAGVPGMDVGKSMFNSTLLLPDGPVKVGDTWSGVAASPMAVVEMTVTSTLNALSQKEGGALATIGQKQTGTLDTAASQGMPASMKMSGNVSGDGTQVFDTEAGTVQSATGTTSITMTMNFGKPANGAAMPPGIPQSMQMQMQIKFTMKRLSDTAPSAPPAQ